MEKLLAVDLDALSSQMAIVGSFEGDIPKRDWENFDGLMNLLESIYYGLNAGHSIKIEGSNGVT